MTFSLQLKVESQKPKACCNFPLLAFSFQFSAPVTRRSV